MQLNKLIFRSILAVALLGILFTSCKKKSDYTIINTTNNSETQTILTNDELNINYEFDQAINEAILATNISPTASGDSDFATTGNALYTVIKNAVIDTTSLLDSGLVKITYFGKNADNTKGRTGTVTVKLALDGNGKVIPWKTQGAIASITFNQYEVIILATNKSLWLNGTGTITNLSGGILKNTANLTLAQGDSLIDRVAALLAFTYNDNTNIIQTWTWNFDQHRSFVLNGSVISSYITGNASLNGFNNIATSGTTRSGENFYTGITAPVLQTISDLFILSEPLSGEKAIHGIAEPMDVIYGVDAQGNPATNNPYGYKIIWINNGGQAQAVVAY